MKKQIVRLMSLFVLIAALCLLPIYTHAAGKKMSLQWKAGKRTVEAGKKLTLKVKIRNKKRGSKLVWTSSSKKIATVSKQGVVSGKKAGKVKITVKIRGTKVKLSCKIKVVKPANPVKSYRPSDVLTPPPKKTTVPQETTVPSPVPSQTPSQPTTPDITAIPNASPSVEPSSPTESPSGPTVTAAPTTSPDPVYTPKDTELIPYSGVMEINGEIMTVYLVHKNYEGQVHMRMNGKEYTAGGNAKDALMALAYGGTTKTNSAGTIRVSRSTDESGSLVEYWDVEDLEQGLSYQMKAETKNTINPAIANCGVIYFRGDVTSAIEIY